jgi:hypothetical protein
MYDEFIDSVEFIGCCWMLQMKIIANLMKTIAGEIEMS